MARTEADAAHPGGGTWDLSPDTTLIRLLAANARAYPARAALREKDRGIWQESSWIEVLEKVLACAAGLESLGFAAGDAMLVMGDNRANLYLGMLAAGALGGYAMPLYPDAVPDEVRHFATEVEARFVLAEDQEQVDKILEMRESGVSVGTVVYDDPRGLARYGAAGLTAFAAVVAAGRARLDADPALREALIARAQPDGPAVFVHSSGTTGKPKGVVLSHRNLLGGVRNAHRGGAFGFDEHILAYLPMAWVGDFAMTVGAGVALRFTINIPERAETVLTNLREIAPTFYLAAPRSWDNMLTMIQVRMEDSTPLKKRVYDFFMGLATAAERRKLKGEAPTALERWLRPLGELMVFGPIKDQLGFTRLAHAFTGGEAIGEDTFVFYRALGVQLRQFYGQTESSAYTALQDPGEVRLHTVGRPLPGVELRISDDGEILVKSDSVFGGYFRNDAATRGTLEDGWLHTGDAGYLEADGHLVVLGRLSEVVRTRQGERYIPNYIENRIKFSPYVKDAAVIGAGRDMLTAIICIDREPVGHWAELRGISYISYADLSQKPEVQDLIAAAIRRVNEALPAPLRVTRFVNLHKEFDPDDGEITRTRKLRRNVVEDVYKPVIDALYDGSAAVVMKAAVRYETGETGVIERTLAVKGI